MCPLRNSDGDPIFFALGRIPQNILQNAVHYQVRIPSDRRSEMRVSRSREREVPLILCRVACLLQRTQHKVRKNTLFRLARNLLRQLLIHARCDMHFLRQLERSGLASAALMLSPV